MLKTYSYDWNYQFIFSEGIEGKKSRNLLIVSEDNQIRA